MGKFIVLIFWIGCTIALRSWVGPTFLDVIDLIDFKTIVLFVVIAIGGALVGITEALAPIFAIIGSIMAVLFTLSNLAWVGCAVLALIPAAVVAGVFGVFED